MISLAAGARGWLWLLFSPSGAIGRSLLISGSAVVVVFNLLLTGIATACRSPELMTMACLLTLPMSLALVAKQLRAMGRSVYWQAPVRILMIVGLVSTVAYQHHRSSAVLGVLPFPCLAGGALADLAMFLWLALAPNQRPVEDRLAAFD